MEKCARPSWSGWVAILAILGAQALLFAAWLGSMQTEVNSHAAWIAQRNQVAIDARLAVLESTMTNLTRELALHIQNDTDRQSRPLR